MVNRKLLLVAVVVAALAALAVYSYLSAVDQRVATEPGELKATVFARVDIPARTRITAQQLEVRQIPISERNPEALSDPQAAVGRLAAENSYANQQVLERQLVKEGDTSRGLSLAIPEGLRAVAVPVNEVAGLSFLVRPGDRVDAVATVEIEVEQEPKATAPAQLQGERGTVVLSTFVLQDVLVLSVGTGLERQPEQDGKEVKSVTLAVAAQGVLPLVLASEKGSVRLLLRSPVDRSRVDLPPFRLDGFLNTVSR